MPSDTIQTSSSAVAVTEQTGTVGQSEQTSPEQSSSADMQTSPSAAVLADEDEPVQNKETKPLTIAVNGVGSDYSPFDEENDYTVLMNKLTGVTLSGRTRAGRTILSGASGQTEQYEGKSYSYSTAADTTVSYDEENALTSYTFDLRGDIRFADGKTLTADDVIFTLYVHLDSSYYGSYPLGDAGIVGTLNYRYNTNAADSITQEQIDAALKSEEIKAVIKEKIMIPTLKEQFENVKSMYDDSSYSVYTSKYPSPVELFAFFYALNIKDGKDGEKYSAKGKDEETVISEVADMYDGNYRQLAGMTVGDETAFDEQAMSIAVGYITRGDSSGIVSGIVRSVSGIVKNSSSSVTVTVKGDCTAFENALCGMVIAPLHRYGSMPMYSYEGESYGFAKGKAAAVISENRDKPLGAGPFSLTGCEEGEALLEANRYYYKGMPASQAVRLINGAPSEAAQMIADGLADICASDGSSECYAAVDEANKSIEKIYPAVISETGYGYIGINAENVAIGDGFSNQSYALRKALATAVAAFRAETLDTYFGGCGELTDYPFIEDIRIDPAVDECIVPYMRDVYGSSIYTEGMSGEERREAAKKAVLGYLMQAGYTMADGVITGAPYGGKTEFSAVIAAGGTGDHPSYAALQKASELLGEIGITLEITDTADAGIIWETLSGGTNEIWAGAWNSESLSKVYIDSYYGLESSTRLKKLIAEAEEADAAGKKEAFMKCYNKIVNEYAVEIPMYRHTKCTLFSTLRVDVSSVPDTATDTYDWTDELDSIRLKQR